MNKVYIKIDNNNNITDINSNIFIQDTSEYILIDQGNGDKYAHAQNNYLPLPLQSEEGVYNYKYINNNIVLQQ